MNLDDTVFRYINLPSQSKPVVFRKPILKSFDTPNVQPSLPSVNKFVNYKRKRTDVHDETSKNDNSKKIFINTTIQTSDNEFSLDFLKDWEMLQYEQNIKQKVDAGNTVYQQSQIGLKKQTTDILNTQIDPDDYQCSQKFFDDLQNAQLRRKHKNDGKIPAESRAENFSYSNTKNISGSEYIQRQRDMYEINLENLDDVFLENFTSQEFNISQYRKEIETEFDVCERTICGENLVDLRHSTIIQEGVNEINWDSPMRVTDNIPIRTPRSASMIVREKLQNLKPSRFDTSAVAITKSTTNLLRPVSTSNFSDRGPFFGLPTLVQSLIKEFKGITKLYGNLTLVFVL